MRRQVFGWVRRAMVVASVTALVPLGACGDDDDGGTADTTTTTTDTSGGDTSVAETTTTTDSTTSTPEIPDDTATDKVTWDEVAGIFRDSCTPCHATSSSGGHKIGATDLAVSYAASQQDASEFAPAACDGKKVGECALIRIDDGSMPLGAGCADDPTQAACPTAAEQALVQDWIDDGMLGPAE